MGSYLLEVVKVQMLIWVFNCTGVDLDSKCINKCMSKCMIAGTGITAREGA